MITFEELQVGDRVTTIDGNVALVLAPSEDGEWILVRYVETPGEPTLAGTEDLCSTDELVDKVQA